MLDRTGRRRLLLKARAAESNYSRELRSVARQVGRMISAMHNHEPQELEDLLRKYAALIKPWSKAVALRMISDVNARTERMWREYNKRLGLALRDELASGPTGIRARELLDQQVELITSIPMEAAERVHRVAQQAMVQGSRAEDVMRDILRTEDITVKRARLIARTEVARSASVLTQARAEAAGSDGYIWRTVGDADVRDSHSEMEGTYVRWDTPPRLSDGTVTHAGQIYNCRCYAEPVLPDL